MRVLRSVSGSRSDSSGSVVSTAGSGSAAFLLIQYRTLIYTRRSFHHIQLNPTVSSRTNRLLPSFHSPFQTTQLLFLLQSDPIIAAANKCPLAYSNTFSPTVTILRSRHFLHIRSDYLQEAYFNGPLQFNDFTRYASTISRSCRATRDQ